MVLASALGLLKGLLLANLLGATEFGYYGLVLLVVQFGLPLSSWGLLNALNNRLPIALGRRQPASADLIKRSLGAQIGTLLITCGIYLAIVSHADSLPPDVRIALMLAAATTALLSLSEFYVLVLRVERRILPLAFLCLLRAGLALAAAVTAAVFWDFRAVILCELVGLLVALVIAQRTWLAEVRPHWPAWEEAVTLIRFGLPLMISNLIVIGTFTIDRLFVASALPDQYGQYAFASLIVIGWMAAVAMLNQTVAPQLLFEHGAGLGVREIARRSWRITLVGAGLGLVGLGILFPLSQSLASSAFDNYGPGLDAMVILYIGGLVSLLAFPGFVAHALRPSYALAAAGLASTVAIVGGLVLVQSEPTLNAFAWLFVASQAVATLGAWIGVAVVARRRVDA